jgi:hypothetical protein
MADQTPQSYANHAQMVPGYHYVTGSLVLAYVVWSIARAVSLRDWESHYDLRLFPLKAQDRVIRLEERLRLQRLLPAELQPRIEEIRPRQLIALRFASDGEVEGLVRQVLAGTLTEPKAIKQAIRTWRPDHFRV